MNSQTHLLKRFPARALRIHPFSSTPLPNSVSDIDSQLVSLCQKLTPRNVNDAFSLFHTAVASNSLPSGLTCNSFMAALTRTRNYEMALSVYGKVIFKSRVGGLMGASVVQWLIAMALTESIYDVGSIFIAFEEDVQLYFYQHSSWEISAACLNMNIS